MGGAPEAHKRGGSQQKVRSLRAHRARKKEERGTRSFRANERPERGSGGMQKKAPTPMNMERNLERPTAHEEEKGAHRGAETDRKRTRAEEASRRPGAQEHTERGNRGATSRESPTPRGVEHRKRDRFDHFTIE
jgi:hypothetical protein